MQSEHKSRHKSFRVIEAEIMGADAELVVPRRRWSQELKAKILPEAFAPGANISAVARRYGLRPQQIFTWRQRALQSGVITGSAPESEQRAFLPVVVAVEPSGSLDIMVGDATIRAGADAPRAARRGHSRGALGMIPLERLCSWNPAGSTRVG